MVLPDLCWDTGMAALPITDDSLLVRTHFGDQAAWQRLQAAALGENEDGFRAYLAVVDDDTLEGASWEQLRAAVLTAAQHASVLFIADEEAMRGSQPLQVVDLSARGRPPFRCVADQLWSVENNLNLANMDWEEFAAAVDGQGVHRGFD
jgi:hypothetical protein